MSHYTASPDYDRYLDYLQEQREADSDAYWAWVEENDLPYDEDHTDAWEEYKMSLADAEIDQAQMEMERLEMEREDW